MKIDNPHELQLVRAFDGRESLPSSRAQVSRCDLNETDLLLLGVDSGVLEEQLLADLEAPLSAGRAPASKELGALDFGVSRDPPRNCNTKPLYPPFREEASHKMARTTAIWALDDRTADVSEISVLSVEPLHLTLTPLARTRAYALGAQRPDPMEDLRSWCFRGFQHLLPILQPWQLEQRLRSENKRRLGSFKGDAGDAERIPALRRFLREQVRQVAGRDGVVGLHAMFNGDLTCSSQPAPDRPRGLPRAIDQRRRGAG